MGSIALCMYFILLTSCSGMRLQYAAHARIGEGEQRKKRLENHRIMLGGIGGGQAGINNILDHSRAVNPRAIVPIRGINVR